MIIMFMILDAYKNILLYGTIRQYIKDVFVLY